ncbi:hypothetical protein HY229_00975 [Candidatus Acetothermia bacterium]|nr:hypothetical protein [Candidatus Acetothermia bacterium]MBI3642663.1 hypothetical protein [Candidatus Acetothermia bacterium]
MTRCYLLFFLMLFAVLFHVSGAGSQPVGNVDLSSFGDYRWLLDSPVRHHLSFGALQFLDLLYGEEATTASGDGDVFALDQILNDRSQDQVPSATLQNETAIAVHGPNVVAGWNDLGQFSSTRSMIGYAYSGDGGITWTDEGSVLPIPGGFLFGDPDVKADRIGNFYFSGIGSKPGLGAAIVVAKSSDGGRTFGTPVIASIGVTGSPYMQDKPFMEVDTSGGRYDGTIYVTWSLFSARLWGSMLNEIVLSRSTDGGRSFSKATPVAPLGGYQFSMPRVGPNGELYVLYEDYLNFGLRITKSVDGGRTFGADGVNNRLIARFALGGVPNLNCGRYVLKGNIRHDLVQVDMAINHQNGDVYVVYDSNPPGADQTDVYFIRSTDGGVSWSQPLRVNDDKSESDQFMGAISVSEDGVIGVTFYDRRNDPENLKLDKYMAQSFDSGLTFGPNFRLSSVSSPVPIIEVPIPCYMGDYDQVASDGEYFYATWGDNRNKAPTWRTGASMPDPREEASYAGIADAVFVIGGYYTDKAIAADVGTNMAYLPKSNRWMTLAPDPVMRGGAAAASKDFSVYVAGGRSLPGGDLLSSFDRYDAFLNHWTLLPPMPTPRAGLGLAVVGESIYALGGRDCGTYAGCGQALAVNEAYDLRSGRWTTKSPMPDARMDFSSAVLNGKIYVLGGFESKSEKALSTVLIYDPVVDGWSDGPSLPEERFSGGAGICNEKLVFFGGYDSSYTVARDVWVFNSASAKWEDAPLLKVARAEFQGVLAADQLFAIGGNLNHYYADGSNRPSHYSGYNEAFPCKTMGDPEPDPDVYFQRIAIRNPSVPSSLQDHSSAKMSANHELQSHPITFRSDLKRNQLVFKAKGKGIAGLRVQIFDLSGHLITEERVAGPVLMLQLHRRLPNGVFIYTLTLEGPGGSMIRSEVKKFHLIT